MVTNLNLRIEKKLLIKEKISYEEAELCSAVTGSDGNVVYGVSAGVNNVYFELKILSVNNFEI